ncbi:unnamed protein product [Schistocephalus solidus]|uniref:Uncharacterized protein n=1 Tax=Schistocephalus solidus TaxID=70667 RepID=A0A3P7DN26_SCHSO|nr:unnamed protein product [Schistocephalus solidus]
MDVLQQVMYAEEFGLLKDFRLGNPVSPCQFRYSPGVAEVEVGEHLGLSGEERAGLLPVYECGQDYGPELCTELHLPQHDVDAEDFGPLQDFRVRDPVLPSQLQYSAEAADMKVIQLPGLVRVDGPGLCSVKECR